MQILLITTNEHFFYHRIRNFITIKSNNLSNLGKYSLQRGRTRRYSQYVWSDRSEHWKWTWVMFIAWAHFGPKREFIKCIRIWFETSPKLIVIIQLFVQRRHGCRGGCSACLFCAPQRQRDRIDWIASGGIHWVLSDRCLIRIANFEHHQLKNFKVVRILNFFRILLKYYWKISVKISILFQ